MMSKAIVDLASLRAKPFRTNTSRLVLFCLLRDVGEDGMVNTSASSIAKELGVCEKTVRNALSVLSEYGVIGEEGPILSPKKVRYAGRTIKLNIVEGCDEKQKSKVRKKSDIKSDMQTQVATQVNDTAKDGFERFRDYFNDAVRGTTIPQITKLTDARKNALRSIFKEHGKETVEKVLQKVLDSDFLSREWGKASFDWIFKKSNFIKILEGNYDNNPTRTYGRPITPAIAAKERRDRGLSLANTIVSRSENLLNLYNGCGPDTDYRENQE